MNNARPQKNSITPQIFGLIQVEVVKNYIQNQKEHHSRKTFQQEYRMFLDKYQVKYDERYVWD